MMLTGGPLRVVLVTTHIPLREVSGHLSTEAVFQKIRLTHQAMLDLGLGEPGIAVAGLNPHGGEGGIFGNEEENIIAPAVRQAQEKGMDVSGPLPPDTVFYKAYRGDFHAVVCMYHDQGLIPLKMIAFESGVNITLGLPFIRTSVDHGTAFDIAGRGLASSESLSEALRMAVHMVEQRRKR
jgi:4-hydroxythreonine-4-phosphate dehydrogenase